MKCAGSGLNNVSQGIKSIVHENVKTWRTGNGRGNALEETAPIFADIAARNTTRTDVASREKSIVQGSVRLSPGIMVGQGKKELDNMLLEQDQKYVFRYALCVRKHTE